MSMFVSSYCTLICMNMVFEVSTNHDASQRPPAACCRIASWPPLQKPRSTPPARGADGDGREFPKDFLGKKMGGLSLNNRDFM